MTPSRAAGRRVPAARVAAAALATAVGLAGVAAWFRLADSSRPITVEGSAAAVRSAGEPAAAARSGFASSAPTPTALREPSAAAAGPDLKRTFDENLASSDPRQKRRAARAFTACVPTFLPASAELASPEPLIRALPDAGRADREAAYRRLYAQCAGFFAESRQVLLGLQRQIVSDVRLQEPGERAQQDLLAGRYDRVDALVAQALSADDPAGVASLAGLAVRFARAESDPPDPGRLRRAKAVDAALPAVACDLGLECGPDSIIALQACAVQGACEGDPWAPVLADAIADGVDAADVQAERSRLLALLRRGGRLGTADLLP
jgi:hypothetical protein